MCFNWTLFSKTQKKKTNTKYINEKVQNIQKLWEQNFLMFHFGERLGFLCFSFSRKNIQNRYFLNVCTQKNNTSCLIKNVWWVPEMGSSHGHNLFWWWWGWLCLVRHSAELTNILLLFCAYPSSPFSWQEVLSPTLATSFLAQPSRTIPGSCVQMKYGSAGAGWRGQLARKLTRAILAPSWAH